MVQFEGVLDKVSGYHKSGIAVHRPAPQRQANFDRRALDSIDWSAVPKKFGVCASQVGIWKVWTTEHIAQGACYTNTTEHVLVLHPTTWRTICFKPETQAVFLRNFTQGASGMKFLCMDSGPYGEAARLEALRDATVQKKDALEQLAAHAESLIVQASGLASGATQVQMRIFSERYCELQTDLEDIERRLTKVKALVELAGDTVMGACS